MRAQLVGCYFCGQAVSRQQADCENAWFVSVGEPVVTAAILRQYLQLAN